MAKLEKQHILQAQMCDCLSTKNEAIIHCRIIKSAKSTTFKKENFEIRLRKSVTRPSLSSGLTQLDPTKKYHLGLYKKH